jgi:hypothetical protein
MGIRKNGIRVPICLIGSLLLSKSSLKSHNTPPIGGVLLFFFDQPKTSTPLLENLSITQQALE